jgi:hypothetical protein
VPCLGRHDCFPAAGLEDGGCTDRHVAAQAPNGRCLDICGWGTWPNAREVTLDELELLRFVPAAFDQHTEDVARALLSALDPDCVTFVR